MLVQHHEQAPYLTAIASVPGHTSAHVGEFVPIDLFICGLARFESSYDLLGFRH